MLSSTEERPSPIDSWQLVDSSARSEYIPGRFVTSSSSRMVPRAGSISDAGWHISGSLPSFFFLEALTFSPLRILCSVLTIVPASSFLSSSSEGLGRPGLLVNRLSTSQVSFDWTSYSAALLIAYLISADLTLLERVFMRLDGAPFTASDSLNRKVEGGQVSNPKPAFSLVVVILKSSVTRITFFPSWS